MAYSELIKNFERVRSYLKEFYIFGFRKRDDIRGKSGRSYDNERRRIEGFLEEYIGHRQTQLGKNVYVAIDTRSVRQNPLYKVFKAKSFTDGDITLHFVILDILRSEAACNGLSFEEICRIVDDEYLNCFEEQTVYDESTIRKKLREYEELGLLRSERRGRKKLYMRGAETDVSAFFNAAEFFSEVVGCGVVGSFLLDRRQDAEEKTEEGRIFSFKHHYLSGAIDSEIAYGLLTAIFRRRLVSVKLRSAMGEGREYKLVPLKILVSAQSGRQYLAAYNPVTKRMEAGRLDRMSEVSDAGDERQAEEACAMSRNELLKRLDFVRTHAWGVAFGDNKTQEHVEFTVRYEKGEEYIYRRLLREKRIGTVERCGENLLAFKADVFDASELIPWIRTFTGRIERLNFSNRTLENAFKGDIEEMYRLYGLGEPVCDESHGGDMTYEGGGKVCANETTCADEKSIGADEVNTCKNGEKGGDDL